MVETYGSHETKFSYVEETSYGQTPGTTMYSLPAAFSAEPDLNPALVKVRGLGSVDLQAIRRGLRHVDFKVDWPLPRDEPIHLLNYAFDLSKSLSIELIYFKGLFASATDIISLLYKGCRFNRVNVSCSVEDYIKASGELIGQNVDVRATKVGGTYIEHGEGDNAVVFFNESYVKKGGETLERVTDYQFTIENNLKRIPVIKTAEGHILKYLVKRQRDLTGELTFEFESKEEYEEVIGTDQFGLEFGLGGGHKIEFSNCKWGRASTPTRIEDLVSLKAPFVARGVEIT